jgi:hypothetical protein
MYGGAWVTSRVAEGWRRLLYGALVLGAVVATVMLWLLMVVEEGRSPAAATAQLGLMFTNLTTILVAVVAAGIAAHARWRWLPLGHLTVTAMAVVTAFVNMLLLDPALPAGWWGVVDLLQHYLIPAALLVLWRVLGPRFTVRWSLLPAVAGVPLIWLAVVLVRGSFTGLYPYDFLDAGEEGWPSVFGMIGVIVALTLGLAAGLIAADTRRSSTPSLGALR